MNFGFKPNVCADDLFGFVRPFVDAHTLGINHISKLLKNCGYRVVIGGQDIADAVNKISCLGHIDILEDWLRRNHVTRLGFSYRLDPESARELFGRLYYQLIDRGLLSGRNPVLRSVYFAGLPEACSAIDAEYRGKVPVFKGDETPIETLEKLGVPLATIPRSVREQSEYEDERLSFGRNLLGKGEYHRVRPVDRSGYPGFGTRNDHLMRRLEHAVTRQHPPLIRVHVGPYRTDRKKAVAEFLRWIDELAQGGLLDIVSIGTSQLTQSQFGEEWGDAPNGGGVPVNSEEEYARIWEAARPMLVRTYAGTSRIAELADIHERTLNIAWHALSFWWFSQIDGRGPNGVLENLREHFKALDFIARSDKPFEPNIPHHFAFRGSDDVTYVLSAVLAARAAKKRGVRFLVLQNMLNTPKYTTGMQDLAKSRAILQMVRELEDEQFRVVLQPRAGLDYFSPDSEKARAQLAASTALMDDIEPRNASSPEIIHVVSYSEASHLADPPVIHESIQIVRQALEDYRIYRRKGFVPDLSESNEVRERTVHLQNEVRDVLSVIEREISDPYTPEGLYRIFAAGFMPAPYLWECRDEFIHALQWETGIVQGGTSVVDAEGQCIPARIRAEIAASNLASICIP